MDEDEIHYLRSSQDPLKSEALRSTRKNTAFTESSYVFSRKVQHLRVVHFTGGSDHPQKGTFGRQERKDKGLAAVKDHVCTEYCTIGSQPGIDGWVCASCDRVCTV